MLLNRLVRGDVDALRIEQHRLRPQGRALEYPIFDLRRRDELTGEAFERPPEDKPLAAAAYDVGDELTAYVEPLAVGDSLPEMPLFLEPGIYVPAPLEATYMTSWSVLPAVIRGLVDPAFAKE